MVQREKSISTFALPGSTWLACHTSRLRRLLQSIPTSPQQRGWAALRTSSVAIKNQPNHHSRSVCDVYRRCCSLSFYKTLRLLIAFFTPLSAAEDCEPRSGKSGTSGRAKCPPVWSAISSDLREYFIFRSTCSDLARQAIRLAFHDCFPGTCDGSIVLAGECWERPENAQMTPICDLLSEKAEFYDVGMADLIQYAAAIGLASCRDGPKIPFRAGRTDDFDPSPEGVMPAANTDAKTMVRMWAAKGFSITELVALAGAHTIGRQLDGAPMSTNIGVWSERFYNEVSEVIAPATVPADAFMSNNSLTKDEWRRMGSSRKTFFGTFAPAMEKMGLMGYHKEDLVDCSEVVSWYAGHAKAKRDVVLMGQRPISLKGKGKRKG